MVVALFNTIGWKMNGPTVNGEPDGISIDERKLAEELGRICAALVQLGHEPADISLAARKAAECEAFRPLTPAAAAVLVISGAVESAAAR